MGVIALPAPPQPLGAYVAAARAGDLLFLSGMLPLEDGRPKYTGVIGHTLHLEDAREAARIAALNGLAAARAALGSLEHIRQVARLAVYLRTSPTFTAHATVADAASAVLHSVLGPAAAHTRLVFGVASLPAGMPVELELILEVD